MAPAPPAMAPAIAAPLAKVNVSAPAPPVRFSKPVKLNPATVPPFVPARFQVAPAGQQANPPDPRQWLQAAETVQGSWWPHYSSWLAERSGGETDRPGQLGDKGFGPMEPAPGLYVLDR